MITELNLYALHCCGYSTHVTESVLEVHARFHVHIGGMDGAEKIAEAQRRIALTLCSGPIDVVKATEKPRCFYCGQLNDEDRNTCSQCGGVL